MEQRSYFQDFMPGNICFGCGKDQTEGLHVKSYWEGEEAVCVWHSQEKYQGWKNVLNGGILASIIDCHTMGTAMAAAYKAEGREMNTQPDYRYATGTMTVKYLKPTPNDIPITLRAKVTELKGKKIIIHCDAWSGNMLPAKAEEIAIRVVDTCQTQQNNPFAG
mgnify:CR=1 FL=1